MSLWVDLGVPLGAAAIAAAAALLGSYSGGRNDKAAWLRNERRAAFVTLLTSAEAVVRRGSSNDTPPEDADPVVTLDLITGIRSAANTVEVLGPEGVLDPARALYEAAMNYIDPAASGDEPVEVFTAYESARSSFAHAARAAIT